MSSAPVSQRRGQGSGQTPPRAPPTPPPPAPGTPGCMRRGRWGAASGGWWWGAVLPPAVEGGVSILEVKRKAPRELSRPMEGSAEDPARPWTVLPVGTQRFPRAGGRLGPQIWARVEMAPLPGPLRLPEAVSGDGPEGAEIRRLHTEGRGRAGPRTSG